LFVFDALWHNIAFSLVWLLLLGCYIKVFTDFSLTVQLYAYAF